MFSNSSVSITIYRTDNLHSISSINITSLSWWLLVKRNRSPATWWASCSSSLSRNYKLVHRNDSVYIVIFFNILLLPRLTTIFDLSIRYLIMWLPLATNICFNRLLIYWLIYISSLCGKGIYCSKKYQNFWENNLGYWIL